MNGEPPPCYRCGALYSTECLCEEGPITDPSPYIRELKARLGDAQRSARNNECSMLRKENKELSSKLDKAERMHREAFDAGVAHQERANALQLRLDAAEKELQRSSDAWSQKYTEMHRRCQLAEGAVLRKIEAEQAAGAPLAKRLAMAGYVAEQERRIELESRLEEQAKRLGTMFDLLADVATKERKDALGFVTVSLRMHSDWWRAVDAIVFGSSSAPVERRDTK